MVSSAAELDIELDAKQKRVEQAYSYATKGAAEFPAPEGVIFDGTLDKDWAARKELLAAIQAYAGALTEANDPKLSASATEAASKLSVALNGFIATTGATEASKKAGSAVGSMAASFAGFTVEIYSGARIREVMRKTHPTLERACNVLKQDMNDLIFSIKSKRDAYHDTLINNLSLYVKDSRINKVQRMDLYMSASNEYAGIEARIEILEKVPKALDDLVKAHKELLDDVDDKRALVALQTLVDSLAQQIGALP